MKSSAIVVDADDTNPADRRPQCCAMAISFLKGKMKPKIETQLSANGFEERKSIKVLTLGAGDAGKSTILKQMRVIHGQGYTADERLRFKPALLHNIVDSVLRLVSAMKTLFHGVFERADNERHLTLLQACAQQLSNDKELADWQQHASLYLQAIKAIWNDSAIQETYRMRNEFYVSDSTQYFMDNIEKICEPNYTPTLDDLLRVRQPTTSIHEYAFRINRSDFVFVDVGGQRSERLKWLYCLENVSCMLYVASLSDFDMHMSAAELVASNVDPSGDIKINRMRDSLDLFRTLINWKRPVSQETSDRRTRIRSNKSRNASSSSMMSASQTTTTSTNENNEEVLLFENVALVLFLNKQDLFEEKIKSGKSTPRECFDDYPRDKQLSVHEAKDFIAHKYLACDEHKRTIYWHYTYALDKRCIEAVIASIRDQILNYMLELCLI